MIKVVLIEKKIHQKSYELQFELVKNFNECFMNHGINKITFDS